MINSSPCGWVMPPIHLPTILVVVSRISLVRSMKLLGVTIDKDLAPVVQKVASAIQWINHYPLDNSIGFASVYPVDSDLSGG